MIKKNYGKTNRKMGHDAERWYAKKFRESGFIHCMTSRKGSRFLDDMGIDLMNIPVNIQIKAGHQRGLNYANELKMIAARIEKMPPMMREKTLPNILIHKKHVGKGKKRSKFDEIVILSFSDYIELLKKVHIK